MLLFLTQLCELLPPNLLSASILPPPPPPPPCVKLQHIQAVCAGGGGVLSAVGDHILQEFNTLYLTSFRPYKIVIPPQTKT
jgi:hypothetical protein